MSDIPADSPLRRAPTLLAVETSRLPQAKRLGTPVVRTLLGYTRRVLHLSDGHTLAVFSFGGSAQANWLFLIDSRRLTSERFPIPNNDIASHGAALGRDGHIYLMPYGNGRAYRFDTRVRQFTPLQTGLPSTEYTWEAFGASNGRLYFGTYPSAYFGEYDPAADRCELWRQVVPNTKYVTQFDETGEGRIRFKAWGPDEVWMTFDPQKRRLERAAPPLALPTPSAPLPDPPPGDERFQGVVTVEGRRFALGFPSSRLWEIRAEAAPVLCGDPRSPAEPWYLETVADSIVGISHFGTLFRYNPRTGNFKRGALDNRAPGGNPIMFLEAVTPRHVIGANYSQQNLFCIDPQTGRIHSSDGMVARVTGEPMCAVGYGGRAYVGIYVRSILSVYDPKRPFEYGKNPRELIELGARYAQTRPRAAVAGDGLVFISSDSDYNHLGGALAVIDPRTERVEVYHHLIRDQNLPTLAYDPAARLLWGGTDRWGQMRSHPPTQPSALIYAFDPAARKVVTTLTPWPGANVVSVLGVSTNGILVASSGKEIALIDTASCAVLYQGPMPTGIPALLRRGADGLLYYLSGGTLHRWDLARNEITPVAASPGCYHLAEPTPGTWLLANATTVYVTSLR